MLRKLAALAVTAGLTVTVDAQMQVSAVSPTANSLSAPVGGAISVTFDRPVNPLSVNTSSFWAFGRWSGPAEGTLTVDGSTVTLVPDESFSAGETVTVYLSTGLRGLDAMPLRPGGYSFQYWTRARSATIGLDLIDTITTNGPGESSQPYGGVGCDLDNDGWLDVTTINEVTADMRVFMNKGDGSGLYDPYLQPTFDVLALASPSEGSDFNRDGNVDVCVADSVSNAMSVLIGNGDGTFLPQQIYTVIGSGRGIAVLDADGDGDIDVATTNTNNGGGFNGSITVHYNNGLGFFGSPHTFDGGVVQEWSLASADMDGDGLLDLIVGGRNGQTMAVHLGNGDGTFTQSDVGPAGGATWMIAVGDLNGDGHQDVVSGNGTSNNGAVLLGDGAGNLGNPTTFVNGNALSLATDLGDLDGDGDLDWTISNYNGNWLIYQGLGNGSFLFDQQVIAPDAASCTILMDIDNDRDLDLTLVDELEDVLIFAKNDGTLDLADVNRDGAVDVNDLVDVITGWGPCPLTGPCDADVNGDGKIDVNDLVEIIVNWSS